MFESFKSGKKETPKPEILEKIRNFLSNRTHFLEGSEEHEDPKVIALLSSFDQGDYKPVLQYLRNEEEVRVNGLEEAKRDRMNTVRTQEENLAKLRELREGLEKVVQ